MKPAIDPAKLLDEIMKETNANSVRRLKEEFSYLECPQLIAVSVLGRLGFDGDEDETDQ